MQRVKRSCLHPSLASCCGKEKLISCHDTYHREYILATTLVLQTRGIKRPFGGLQIILSGDLFQ